MARVLPFVGTRYNPKAIEDLSSVMAPPYDVISPALQEALAQRHPYNIVRLILGKDQIDDDEYNNKYQRAASYLKDWKSKGILMDDPCKNFYIYQQEFTTPDGKRHKRTGFFAAILVEDPEQGGMIKGHEQTFEGPKADRLKLLRSTNCNLSPIFCLYSDKEKAGDEIIRSVIEKEQPRIELKNDEDVVHRLWLMSGSAKVKQLSALMQSKNFFIADGHHRYETALRYAREMARSQNLNKKDHPPFTYVMAYLTNCDDEGIVILPTHRVLSAELGEGVDHEEVIRDLKEFFNVIPVHVDLKKSEAEAARLTKEVEVLSQKGPAFAMVLPGGKGCILSLKPDTSIGEEMRSELPPVIANLDVSILHEYLIPKVWVGNPEMELDDHDIFYVRGASNALDMLGHPTFASAVFLMNAPRVEQVQEIAGQNLRMPHKTTYFYPKLLTGMVLRDLSAPW